MHILFYISRFGIGGIQTFVIQLAKELVKQQGVQVSIFCHYPEWADRSLNEPVPPQVKCYTLTEHPKKIIWINRFRNWIKWLFPNFDFKEWLTTRYFLKLAQTEGVDLIHNNIQLGDANVLKAYQDLGIPYLTTLHGAYKDLNLEDSTQIAVYQKHFQTLLSTAFRVVYLSPANLLPFHQVLGRLSQEQEARFSRIFNGLTKPELPSNTQQEVFIFGLIARGVPEKGWEEAILAMIELVGYLANQEAKQQVELHLYGESPYLDQLAEKYAAYQDFILFCGPTDQPLKVIASFKIGLLPTYLPQEEMPFTIIEYLACGKPVLATDRGAIVEMLKVDQELAGEIISVDTTGKAVVSDLLSCMRRYVEQPDYYYKKAQIAQEAFQKFDISQTTKQYYSIYKKALKK